MVEIRAISSVKSRSSSWSMNLHLILVLACLVVSHVIQSVVRRNRKPDVTQPCLTPVLTLNHSDVGTGVMNSSTLTSAILGFHVP